MATQNGEDVRRPEEKVAGEYRKRRGVTGAIDIIDFAREFADLEYDVFPNKADGLLLRSRLRKRPLILVSGSISTQRQIFTIAHELGHLLLSWHNNPLFFDEIGQIKQDVSSPLYRRLEAEANRFASEILMPRDWISQLLDSGKSLDYVFEEINKVGVSHQAAAQKIIESAGIPLVHIETDKRNSVVKARRSKSTLTPLPPQGALVDSYLFSYSECYTVKISTGTSLWWKLHHLENNTGSSPRILSSFNSKTVMETILKDLSYTISGEDIDKIRKSVNSVVGGIKSMMIQNKEIGQPYDGLSRMDSSLSNHPNLREFSSHPKYQSFIETAFKEIRI